MVQTRSIAVALAALAVLYAGLAGLRSVGDADLGWQLATGRYVLENRSIPSQDVFSWTAAGREWIYPPFSGAIFFLFWKAGGFEALSWLSAAASLATALVLLAGGGTAWARALTATLAILAVPFVAARTKARSDLFSTLFFAVVLIILWRHYRGRRSPLWILPVVMCLWVNLHLGFVAGLALLGAYLGMEVLELPFRERRAAARARLRRALPWLAAAVAATAVNPWGPRLYVALARQNRILASIEGYVGEWFPVRISSATLRELLALRHPESAFSWFLLAALLAAAVAVWTRAPGPALLMAGTLLGPLRYIRFQVLFVMVVVVVAGELLADLPWRPAWAVRRERALVAALLAALALLVTVRVSDLATNRYYLSVPDNVVFGPGVSWWYPQRAAAFLKREQLPQPLMNDYNIGGYLAFAVAPEYKVSIDNRAVPFGAGLFFLHKRLLTQPPGTPEWQQALERWHINTLLVSIARYGGISGVPLREFCAGTAWTPVYLDEVSVIFVRNTPENTRWTQRLRVDCATVQLKPPETTGRAELYNFHANAGWVLAALGRSAGAVDELARAAQLFDADPQLYLIRGSVLQGLGRIADAQRDYRRSLELRESDQAWYALGQAQAAQGRFAEAAANIERGAHSSLFPHEIYRVLGEVYLAMNRPREALAAFDDAERTSPYRGDTADMGGPFHGRVAAGRAKAWQQLGDPARALAAQKRAVELSPADPQLWLELAALHQSQGHAAEADQARARAAALGSR